MWQIKREKMARDKKKKNFQGHPLPDNVVFPFFHLFLL
jgi:hypothetical protein